MMKIHENSKMYKIFVVTGSFQYLVEAKIEEEGRDYIKLSAADVSFSVTLHLSFPYLSPAFILHTLPIFTLRPVVLPLLQPYTIFLLFSNPLPLPSSALFQRRKSDRWCKRNARTFGRRFAKRTTRGVVAMWPNSFTSTCSAIQPTSDSWNA